MITFLDDCQDGDAHGTGGVKRGTSASHKGIMDLSFEVYQCLPISQDTSVAGLSGIEERVLPLLARDHGSKEHT
jgi:hypothetical protein